MLPFAEEITTGFTLLRRTAGALPNKVFGLLATSPARAEVWMNFLRLSFINGHLLKMKRELDFVVRQEMF